MVESKGLIYRTQKQVTDLLHRPASVRYLEERYNQIGEELFDTLPENAKTIIDSKNVPYFTTRLKLVCIPSIYFSGQKLIEEMSRLKEHPLLTVSTFKDRVKFLIDVIKEMEMEMEDLEFQISTGKIDPKLVPSSIFVFRETIVSEDLIGIYSGIPAELEKGPLSQAIVYSCSSCDAFDQATSNYVPDFYYSHNGSHYCSKCASKLGFENMRKIGT